MVDIVKDLKNLAILKCSKTHIVVEVNNLHTVFFHLHTHG